MTIEPGQTYIFTKSGNEVRAIAQADTELENACEVELQKIRGPYVPGMDEATEYHHSIF